ncbi:MerR family transcriptional regulator [Mycobacterium deserti]|uniref:MerR family transcriptional regulator n=1 Tax=Mycobacterium deserti TaxID=2978347 RepID=A0ABT2ME46_9MYCO|nr:MerR family transcriptional regulator [Mycobacterium deserti]MCT7660545.1 MerR family transcriptional regulator [Mycobacterium deserti]
MAEYRLDDLARVSGVSARNIRAYRERGLLDPPRRVGRSAYYDDYHLSQLRTINQLLRRGFNSAHIAEFFTSMRQGADLADILGIQRAVLGPQGGTGVEVAKNGSSPAPPAGGRGLDISPDSDEARTLISYELAEVIDNAVVLVDPTMAEIVARAGSHMLYVRALLRIFEGTRAAVDNVASAFVHALTQSVTARFGPNYVPRPDEMDELTGIVQDYRDLGRRVVRDRLDKSLQEQMVTALSEYTADVLVSRQLEPKNDVAR